MLIYSDDRILLLTFRKFKEYAQVTGATADVIRLKIFKDSCKYVHIKYIRKQLLINTYKKITVNSLIYREIVGKVLVLAT